MKLSIDFGTTNTVVAVWRDGIDAPETLNLPGLSMPPAFGVVPLIPTILYVQNGTAASAVIGHEVIRSGLDGLRDNRLFSSFKRGIVARTKPMPRQLDGEEWDDARAGGLFLHRLLDRVVGHEGRTISELVLTVPIESFEDYLRWLREEASQTGINNRKLVEQVRVVDESTAAALGYHYRTPGELVLVFDFGGGTLDISLVRMPVSGHDDSVSLGESDLTALAGVGNRMEARVVAKAGRVLGGDDIDHWMLDELLRRNGKTRAEAGLIYSQLRPAVEAAKIRLSTQEQAEIAVFDPDTYQTYRATFTRSQLEELLDANNFFGTIQKILNKVLRAARVRGIFNEDISAVLLIGGTSQIPSVRRLLRAQFDPEIIHEDKPFEAVAHGALSLTTGTGVDDFLYHSYGVRHLSPITGRHEWEEIIPSGMRYPFPEPVKLILTASRDGQEALELVVGEVEESAGGISEVMFGDRAILMVDGAVELRRIKPLNDEDGSRTVAHLSPPGKAGEDRVEVAFDVDRNRTLRVTVLDLSTNEILLENAPVVDLR